MSNKINFGEHEGQTFEWMFFHAPWYTQWMVDNRIHRDHNKFSDDEIDYFSELFHRATHLTGLCSQCKERPFTTVGLTIQQSGALGMVGFYCDECEYLGGSQTLYSQPSFFVDTNRMPQCEQLRIVKAIKNHYLGLSGRLTQARMEEFFRNDANFIDPDPDFFANMPAG